MAVLLIVSVLYLAGFVICRVKTAGKSQVSLRDCLNPRNWISYVIGTSLASLIPLHVMEQYIIRIKDEECRKCVKAGACLHCGCNMPERALDPWQTCSAGNWGPIIFDRDEYENWKKEVGLKIEVAYGAKDV